MIIIPAIDIIDGKPVRLYQGDYDKKEIVGKDILEIAKSFEETESRIYSFSRFRWSKSWKISQ